MDYLMSRRNRFESLLQRAEIERGISDKPDYWVGYLRGLRRTYYGDAYGTDEEHALWLGLSERRDQTHRDQGEGYLAGLAALDADADADRRLPSAQEVRAFLRKHGITGAQAARMMYLSDSRQVRKYTGGDSPRSLDLARWFALHAHLMLSSETIAEIEAAMSANANANVDEE